MKRVGNLIESIANPDNLRLAFYKAQKGKTTKNDVIFFSKHLDKNLALIREQILNSSFDLGNYHQFTIYEPKKRQICAAPFRERVLHHAIINICHPVFERCQIFDSYACRKGKGTHAALLRALYFQKKHKWHLKLDIRKFFDSVDQQILFSSLKHIFKDKKLLDIFNTIISSYAVLPGKGIPIGNLTSQYFANHLLSAVDHFVKETLQIPGYVRYMDDMVLWHNDKSKLLEAGKRLKDFISNEFCLELKPFCLNQNIKGLPFLSHIVFPYTVKLSNMSKQRFANKMKKYCEYLENEIWSQDDFKRHIEPLIAFTGSNKGFRKKVLENIEGQWPWVLTA